MPESGTPHDLRARAASIRTTARRLEDAQALDLHRRAGPDVWLGPTPTHCLDSLVEMRGTIIGAAHDLLAAARTLEVRAEGLTHDGDGTSG